MTSISVQDEVTQKVPEPAAIRTRADRLRNFLKICREVALGDEPLTAKETVGAITAAASIAFSAGLLLCMIRYAWFEAPTTKSAIVFAGFVLPMLVMGHVTFVLWFENVVLLRRLGWAFVVLSTLYALGLFLLVSTWGQFFGEYAMPDQMDSIGLLIGFTVPLLSLGGLGVAYVTRKED